MTETQQQLRDMTFELAAARTEVKEYRDSCDVLDEALTQCADANKDFARRLTEARAEVERLKQLLETEQRVGRMIGSSHKADVAELLRVRAERDAARTALRQILTDPDAQILDSDRDDGWTALGQPAAQDTPQSDDESYAAGYAAGVHAGHTARGEWWKACPLCPAQDNS